MKIQIVVDDAVGLDFIAELRELIESNDSDGYFEIIK